VFLSPVPGGFPSNLTVNTMEGDSLLVSWNPLGKSSYHGILLGYALRYYEVNSTHNFTAEYQTQHVPPSANSLILDALGRFALYGIQISAFNERGFGPWSDVLTFYTAEDGR